VTSVTTIDLTVTAIDLTVAAVVQPNQYLMPLTNLHWKQKNKWRRSNNNSEFNDREDRSFV